ncbi:pikachurin-like protein [Leptotrombidium deliense]|uniref:Pikachurin-like protein n=1 Tax=Leptotrombidium deliense TaxID=299467 RepID=A0A443SES4_9ACAR|nr:pikachurin-like protein [Leptotrombidium deliense]
MCQCTLSKGDKNNCGISCFTESDFTIPSFNGSSYLQFPGFGKNALSFVEIKIVFKARASNGLLFYNGNRMDGSGDFLSINLVDGFVEFRFDLGTGPAILSALGTLHIFDVQTNNKKFYFLNISKQSCVTKRLFIRSLLPISVNEWHMLSVSRTGRKGILEVDGQPRVEDYSKGAFTQLYLPLNLFIGGVSDLKDVSQTSDISQSFVGCIQKVMINGRNLLLLEEALSGVNIADCPHPCASQPCFQGGRCEPKMEYYTCHCPMGFVGTKCELTKTN